MLKSEESLQKNFSSLTVTAADKIRLQKAFKGQIEIKKLSSNCSTKV